MDTNFIVLAQVWIVIGLALAILGLSLGRHRLGNALAQASWGFRLLIMPSIVILWPLFLLGLYRGRVR